MNTKENATMYESVPVVSELNKVQGFDPLKFLRKTRQGGKNLDLNYKKLWFRLKYPSGRIKLSALKITDQLAIIEARVYFDKNDTQPRASFIAQRDAKTTPGGLYIESAQHAAIDQALSDAGFGVQFAQSLPGQETAPVIEAAEEQPAVMEAAAVTQTEETPAETETGNPAVVQTVIETPAEATENTVPEPPAEEADGEEVETCEEETASAAAYTPDMSVEEICSMMTYEEAGNVIVPIGTCKDWSMSQVADRRPASLKWYISGYKGDDNILRAAATIMQSTLDMQEAS